MKATVILNGSAGAPAASGSEDTADRVRAAFERAGVEAIMVTPDREAFVAAVKNAAASDSDAVVLGGGDGTMNVGAMTLVGGSKPLGILPLGSLNHFAKDVGIPMDLDEAVDTIRTGNLRTVDVGEVTRFLRPLARFRRYIHEDVDPFVVMDGVAVMGLNTARSNTWKDGRISAAQIEGLRERFAPLPAGVLKVLVTHHPFLPPPEDPSPPIVGRAMEALRAAEACGIHLVLAGHLHHGYTGDVRTLHTGIRRAILVAQAGTATSHRVRNEPNSYNVLAADSGRLRFALRVWNGKTFAETRTADYTTWFRPTQVLEDPK